MSHLEDFLFSVTEDIARRLGGRGARSGRNSHDRSGRTSETEEQRLARTKRLSFRREAAEGRLETVFPSLLTRGADILVPQASSVPTFLPSTAPSGNSNRFQRKRGRRDEDPDRLSPLSSSASSGTAALSGRGTAVGGLTTSLGPRIRTGSGRHLR